MNKYKCYYCINYLVIKENPSTIRDKFGEKDNIYTTKPPKISYSRTEKNISTYPGLLDFLRFMDTPLVAICIRICW